MLYEVITEEQAALEARLAAVAEAEKPAIEAEIANLSAREQRDRLRGSLAGRLGTALEGAQLTRLDYALGIELTLALLIGFGVLYAAPGMSAARAAQLALGLTVTLAGLSWLLYSRERLLFRNNFV